MTHTKIEQLKKEFEKAMKDMVIVYPKAFVEDAKKYGFEPLVDFRYLKDMGIGKKALWNFFEHHLLKAKVEGRKEILLEWETAIYYSELDKGKLSQKVMENHLKRITHSKQK